MRRDVEGRGQHDRHPIKDLQIITAAARRAAILIEQGRGGADREELVAATGEDFG